MKIRILVWSVLFALMSACASQAATPQDGNAIEISNVVFSLSSGNAMSGMDMGGEVVAHMLIKNSSATADRLIGVATDSGVTMIHETVIIGDVASMKMLDGIDVPGNGTVELKSGGVHIVITNLKAGLKAGDTLTLTLKFKKAGDVTVTTTVTDQ